MEKTIYINYYGPITEQNVNTFMQVIPHYIETESADRVYVLFSSSGGSVPAGLTMYNFILSLKKQVQIVFHNIGSVDSIALIPFMSGDERYSNPHTSFLLHEMTWTLNSGIYSDAQLAAYIDGNKTNSKNTSKIISSASLLSEKEVLTLYKKAEAKDELFAKTKGLIDDIKVIEVPKGAFYKPLIFPVVPLQ